MKILISGASGFLGKRISDYLSAQGNVIFHLVRRNEKSQNEIYWDPYHRNINPSSLEGFDVIIHLSGENVGRGLWTSDKKYRIFKSRVKTTRFLVKTIAKLKQKPQLFICASGIGYYADNGEEWITENSQKGAGFFSDLCSKWEEEAEKIEQQKIRRVSLRMGMVLSKKAGALRPMALPVKFGLGAVMGHGDQYLSWIHVDDCLKLVDFIIQNKIKGVVNGTAPNPVTFETFTRTLARQLH